MARLFMALPVLLLIVGLGVGCKDGEPPSEIEQFTERLGDPTTAAFIDSLYVLSRSDGRDGLYAEFVLGNYFYQQAADSAMIRGWNTEPAISLMDSAEVYFSRTVARDSTFIEGLVNLGSLWDDRSQQMAVREDRERRIHLAETYYRKALAVDPAEQKARCNLGGLYMRQRQNEKALTEFKTALEYAPESALAHYNLAIMFAEAKIYREAITEWELAVKYDPDGDIGARSRENIKIVNDLINAPLPANVQ